MEIYIYRVEGDQVIWEHTTKNLFTILPIEDQMPYSIYRVTVKIWIIWGREKRDWIWVNEETIHPLIRAYHLINS
jgi:hypothetical protein